MATLSPEEFGKQFTPLDPEQIYGNVKTNEPRQHLNSLDEVHPLTNGRPPLSLPGWDDHWSGRLQNFAHITTENLKTVFKGKDRVLVALDRILPPGTPQIIGYTEAEYDKKLKGYLNFESQDQIRKDLSKGLSVFLVASPDRLDHPQLHYIGGFLKGVNP